jgi:hypothetical protein
MGVNSFVLGLASDLQQRCHRLLGLLDGHQPHPDVAEFNQRVIGRLRYTHRSLQSLLESDLIRHDPLWPYALFEYQDRAQETALVEQYAIPILLRYDGRDHQCYQLLTVLAREIGYPPGLLPVITVTSDQYYWAQPELRVVGMPIGDLEGILGWPDLLHELAHLLLAVWPGFLAAFTPLVTQYYQEQRDLLGDIGGSEHDNQWLAVAQIKWGEKQEGTWRVEFAADLIATYLVGPSYGWQHVRLAANHGSDPYDPSPGQVADHPANQARLDALLAMLRLLGLSREAGQIQNRWSDMLAIEFYERQPQGYSLYYPQTLLEALAQAVFDGCRAHGLVPFTKHVDHTNPSLVMLIDRAWQAFNQEPDRYPAWEIEAIEGLKSHFGAKGE